MIISNEYKTGVVVALLSAVCFALSNTFAGLAYTGGVTPTTLCATRFFLPTVLLLFLLPLQGKPIVMAKTPGIIAILLGIITIAYNLAILTAIDRLPVPIAILIFFLFPNSLSLRTKTFNTEHFILSRSRDIYIYI